MRGCILGARSSRPLWQTYDKKKPQYKNKTKTKQKPTIQKKPKPKQHLIAAKYVETTCDLESLSCKCWKQKEYEGSFIMECLLHSYTFP